MDKKTNIKCWFCDCNFFNQPIFIPNNIQKITDSKTINKIDVNGNFDVEFSSYIHLRIVGQKMGKITIIKDVI